MDTQLINNRTEKTYLGDCPDCGYREAVHKFVTIIHPGGEVVSHWTIDCPNCEYHEFILDCEDI